MPCDIDKYHRNNIFNRALVKLTEGLEEKEVNKYLREKLLPGKRYLLKDGMVIESTGSSGQLAIDLVKDMEREPANFRAELSEVIVTNHNKKAVTEWVEAGEGVVHDLSGFKIFKPFILEEWKQQTSNWDFIDAHGPIARVATGGKGQRQILEVLRNTWAVEGLTAALHQAKGLAPIEQQPVYERAARHTALYREEGRTQRKLQDPDAKVAPEWSKKSSLKEAKAARETSQELEKYLDQVKAKAGTEDGKVKGSTLVQKFMIKAGAGYQAIGELLNSKTVSGLKVTFKATDMKDPRVVLDPNAENWGLQVARELLIKGIEQRLETLPRTKAALEALGNPLDSLRLGLRTSEINPFGWKRVLNELKAELPENAKRDAVLDKLWQTESKVEPEYVSEPFWEPDYPEQAAVDSYDAYSEYEDLGPPPEFVPFKEDSYPVFETTAEADAYYEALSRQEWEAREAATETERVAGIKATVERKVTEAVQRDNLTPEEASELAQKLYIDLYAETLPSVYKSILTDGRFTKDPDSGRLVTDPATGKQILERSRTQHWGDELPGERATTRYSYADPLNSKPHKNGIDTIVPVQYWSEWGPSRVAEQLDLLHSAIADISETLHPPTLEPLTEPTEAWVTEGTPVSREYLEQILNTPGLKDVKNILLATETMKPEVIAKALEMYPPEVQQVVAKFMEIWADTRLQFLENFEEALKHIGCNE